MSSAGRVPRLVSRAGARSSPPSRRARVHGLGRAAPWTTPAASGRWGRGGRRGGRLRRRTISARRPRRRAPRSTRSTCASASSETDGSPATITRSARIPGASSRRSVLQAEPHAPPRSSRSRRRAASVRRGKASGLDRFRPRPRDPGASRAGAAFTAATAAGAVSESSAIVPEREEAAAAQRGPAAWRPGSACRPGRRRRTAGRGPGVSLRRGLVTPLGRPRPSQRRPASLDRSSPSLERVDERADRLPCRRSVRVGRRLDLAAERAIVRRRRRSCRERLVARSVDDARADDRDGRTRLCLRPRHRSPPAVTAATAAQLRPPVSGVGQSMRAFYVVSGVNHPFDRIELGRRGCSAWRGGGGNERERERENGGEGRGEAGR